MTTNQQIRDAVENFVDSELRPMEGNDISGLPWRVLRSCATWHFRVINLDKGEPGVLNQILKEVLANRGYTLSFGDGPITKNNKGSYDAAVVAGSWPDFVDKCKDKIGR